MGGLTLGDIILDARRVTYIHSLSAVVCSDLHEALKVGISHGLRSVMERMDAVLDEYQPKHLIVLGSFNEESALSGLARRWGKRTKIHFVASNPDSDARALAEALDCEVHNDLIWGRYRFVEDAESDDLELQLTTIAGKPHYSIRVGNRPFGGMRLVVFIKGPGKLLIPSMSPNAPAQSIFKAGLDRYDVFAVGYQKVLPMGKVTDLKPFMGIVRGLHVAKAPRPAKRVADNDKDLE